MKKREKLEYKLGWLNMCFSRCTHPSALCESFVFTAMEYQGRNILAPMVRTGSLPFRLLALQYGADIVYSEEVVAKGLLKCERYFDDTTKAWNYVDPTSSIGKTMQRRIVLQSCAEESGLEPQSILRVLDLLPP